MPVVRPTARDCRSRFAGRRGSWTPGDTRILYKRTGTLRCPATSNVRGLFRGTGPIKCLFGTSRPPGYRPFFHELITHFRLYLLQKVRRSYLYRTFSKGVRPCCVKNGSIQLDHHTGEVSFARRSGSSAGLSTRKTLSSKIDEAVCQDRSRA